LNLEKEEEMAKEIKKNIEKGAFIKSLERNNVQIKEQRANAITTETKLLFKRVIEDLEIEIKKEEIERENMLDMSSADAQSLIVANEFDAERYIKKDLKSGIKIRNNKLKLEMAKERYNYLFGEIDGTERQAK
jgi:hypothetical protein